MPEVWGYFCIVQFWRLPNQPNVAVKKELFSFSTMTCTVDKLSGCSDDVLKEMGVDREQIDQMESNIAVMGCE